MEVKTLRKEFFQYVILNICGMIGLSCYILADTFFISNGLGANGLTALNLAIPFTEDKKNIKMRINLFQIQYVSCLYCLSFSY